MKVKNVMSTKVIIVKPHYNMRKAAKILYANKISGAPVVNDAGKIVGILSEKDVFRALHPSYKEYVQNHDYLDDFEEMEKRAKNLDKKLVKNYMNRDILIVEEDTPIMKAGALMLANGFNRIPVVRDKKLVGLISRREIYHNILKKQLDL